MQALFACEGSVWEGVFTNGYNVQMVDRLRNKPIMEQLEKSDFALFTNLMLPL